MILVILSAKYQFGMKYTNWKWMQITSVQNTICLGINSSSTSNYSQTQLPASFSTSTTANVNVKLLAMKALSSINTFDKEFLENHANHAKEEHTRTFPETAADCKKSRDLARVQDGDMECDGKCGSEANRQERNKAVNIAFTQFYDIKTGGILIFLIIL